MTEEELIKKLAETKIPEMEIPNHRINLRCLLLSQYQTEQKRAGFFVFLKPALAVSFTFLALLGLVFNASFFFQQNIAFFSPPSAMLAKEIALKDSQFEGLIDKGAIIGEIELTGNKSYLLLHWQEPRERAEQGLRQELSGGAMLKTAQEANFLVEIDFKTKSISKMQELPAANSSLTAGEEQLAKKISNESQIIKEQISSQAVIQEIRIISSKFELIKNGDKIEAVSSRIAEVIYRDNGNIWKSEINLDKSTVESVEFLGEE